MCNRHPKDCAFYCNCNPHHSFSEDRHPVPIKKPKNQDDDDDEDLNDANFDEVSEKTTEKSLMMFFKKTKKIDCRLDMCLCHWATNAPWQIQKYIAAIGNAATNAELYL